MILRPNLALIGFMGAGKSTIGRRCADELGYRFFDTDRRISAAAGKTIPEIFEQDGEAAFRALEEQVVQEAARGSGQVISTGGGVPMNPLNVARLRRRGVVILIWVEPETLVERTSRRSDRPLLHGADDPAERVRCLLTQREPAYRSAAQAVVCTTGLEADEATRRVLEAFRHSLPQDHPMSHGAGLEN